MALFARSFKDAQNYVTPFFIIIILPACVASIPEIELNAATQWIPIANVSLLFRDLLMGTVALEMVFVVFRKSDRNSFCINIIIYCYLIFF